MELKEYVNLSIGDKVSYKDKEWKVLHLSEAIPMVVIGNGVFKKYVSYKKLDKI